MNRDSRNRLWPMAGLLLLLLAALVQLSCNSDGVLAPATSLFSVVASPTEIVIDETAGQTEGTSTITVLVLNANGFPLKDIKVTFSTTAGTMASAGAAGQPPIEILTDENGIAIDILTMTSTDPASAAVTASSATLSQQVTVNRTLFEATDPFAIIGVTPDSPAVRGTLVLFDGRDSGDDDGDTITCYQWEIDSTDNANDEIIQGVSTFSRTFSMDQNLSVILRVSDDPAATAVCPPNSAAADPALFSPDIDAIAYQIVCDPTGPSADAGTDQIITLSSGSASVVLDGGNSSDLDSGIGSYSWNCGNGDPTVGTQVATCTYDTALTFTATLTVVNGCGQTATDTVRITVRNP